MRWCGEWCRRHVSDLVLRDAWYRHAVESHIPLLLYVPSLQSRAAEQAQSKDTTWLGDLLHRGTVYDPCRDCCGRYFRQRTTRRLSGSAGVEWESAELTQSAGRPYLL